jgi:uncharacterized membrane protein YheB (UPF0754 family)
MTFILFPIVGAIIGALTNQIAIKMLFRPYRPIMIGSFSLPLTPGVIPRNREKIAANIAQTFETKLLSSSEIHGFITGAHARRAIEGKVNEMTGLLGPFAGMLDLLKPKIVGKILEGIEDMANEAIEHGGALNIRQQLEEKINAMDIAQLEELILGLSRREFRHITIFGGILGALIGLVQAVLNQVILSV